MSKKEINKKSIVVIGLKGLPAFGGAATVGQNIINQLHQQFKFTVLSVQSHANVSFKMDHVEQHIFNNFPIKKLNIFFYYIKSCMYVLFSNKFDLVHLHHTDGAFILPLLRLKYKVILTSHAQPQFLYKWPKIVQFFFAINEHIAIRFASVFTAVSKPLQQAYQNKYKRNIVHISNGVDLSLATDVKENGGQAERYLLFAAGRIIPSKGLHLFLKALNEIQYKGKVKIAGNLNHMHSYKALILKLSEGLDVDFVGLIKEKRELLSLVKHAYLFIFPSLTEAMSIMLFEAALMKAPLVCSDIVANTAVFNSEEVLFFKSEDTSDLKDKLIYALNNHKHMQGKTIKAYRKIEQTYTWDRISLKYKQLYE